MVFHLNIIIWTLQKNVLLYRKKPTSFQWVEKLYVSISRQRTQMPTYSLGRLLSLSRLVQRGSLAGIMMRRTITSSSFQLTRGRSYWTSGVPDQLAFGKQCNTRPRTLGFWEIGKIFLHIFLPLIFPFSLNLVHSIKYN